MHPSRSSCSSAATTASRLNTKPARRTATVTSACRRWLNAAISVNAASNASVRPRPVKAGALDEIGTGGGKTGSAVTYTASNVSSARADTARLTSR